MIRAPVLLRSLSTAPVVLRRGVASNAAALLAEDDALSKARPFSEVPSPRGAIPLLGHLPLLANKSGKERFELFGRLLKELGPIVRLKLPRPLRNLVLLSNPSETEKVLRNDGQYPLRSTAMGKNLQYMFKDIDSPTPFAFLDGKEWKDLRVLHHKQIRPANVHSYSPGINIATDRLLTALESSRNEDGYVEDIFPPVVNWAMEASAWFALGIDLDLTKEDNEEAKRFQQSIQTFIRSVDYMVQAIPIYKIYPTKKYTEAKESLAAVRLLGRKYVERNRTAIEKRLREGGSTHDGLSLIEQWMIEGNMSEEQCIVSALDMFSAGVDTTANYTTFVLYEIAKHPEVQQKLHQQVVSVLGKDGEADPESLQKMPYLRDVIRETHRVRPVIVGLVRELTKEIELMGYRIPAGTSVLSCTPSCGAGTLKFDPDRWTRDEDKPHPFADLPFGFGPRSCFGRRFAELEMKVLLTKMIRHFNMSVDGPPDAELPVEHETVFRPAVPVKIKLSSRM